MLEADRSAELLAKVLKVAAELLPLWPSARAANQGRLPRPFRPSAAEVALAGRPQGQLHEWLPWGEVWHCRQCAAMVTTAARRTARSLELCPGGAGWCRDLLRDRRGHSLHCADVIGHTVVFCSKCGAWASTKLHSKLLHGCQAPQRAGLQALGRLRRGLHPDQRVAMPAVGMRPL